MSRLLGATLAAALLGVLLPGGLTNPESAEAAFFRCASDQRKIDKVRTWEWDTPRFRDPDQGVLYIDDEEHYVSFKLIADMRYALCPRGDREDLVSPKSIRYCYGIRYDDFDMAHDQNTFALFDGWTMNAEAEDNARSVNPPPKKIPEEGKANCVTQTIAKDERKWLRTSQEPGYEVKATINIHLQPDHSWMMCNNKFVPYRFFKPKTDPNAAGGYWYTGTGRTVFTKRLSLG